MVKVNWIGVQGTGGWSPSSKVFTDWWQPDGAFYKFLRAERILPVDPTDLFVWSTDLNGVWSWLMFWKTKEDRDWAAGGKALRYYVASKRVQHLVTAPMVIIAHSHGIWPMLHAAAEGVYFPRVITMCSPIRFGKGERALADKALPNIGSWVHVYDPRDRTQAAGEIGDGEFGTLRQCPWATLSVPMGYGHSGLLKTPGLFWRWRAMGLLDYMQDGDLSGVLRYLGHK